jgi:membrane protease YdiL (CAAX protease family)
VKAIIRRYPVWAFFVIIIALGWVAVIVGTTWMPIDAEHEMTAMHGVLVFVIASPSVVGIVLTAVVDGRQGLKELWSRTTRWRVHIKWYVAALLVPFMTAGLSYVVYGLLTGGPLVPPDLGEQFAFILPFAVMACLLEEYGWRGFALPRLQARYNALVSALIVGVGWALWHTAVNYLGLAGQHEGWLLFPLLLVASQLTVVLSVLLSWIHNNSRGSMLLVILCHFSVTMGNVFLPITVTTQDVFRANLTSVAVHWLVALVIIVTTGPKHLVRESRSSRGCTVQSVESS